MGDERVSLELIGTILRDVQAEQRAIRAENREARGLLLSLSEQLRRLDRRVDDIERRIVEQRDDLELMIKAELMGRLGHFETQIDYRLARIEDRVAALEHRPNG
jgi:predicted  nucleic acid-binding Zn-ribbon protein